tara:strand:- start:2146 stop:2397 length:252 start_codon:yes stop_codon:yes gene_type:complete
MELDENYRILHEENNVILQFYENRIRTKKDNSNEEYEFTQNYYHPTLKSALKSYLNKSIAKPSISEVINKIEEVEKLILKLNK